MQPGQDADVVEVATVTMDELVGNDVPSLIKVDVEGYEFEVLNGAKRVLENPTLKGVIVEMNESGRKYGVRDEDVHERLFAYGV